MSATLNKNLLDSEGEAAPKSHRRIVVASAAIASLLSAGFVGYSVGKSSVKLDKFAAVNAPMSSNYTVLGEILETQCYRYLGSQCKGNTDKACSDYGAQCDGSECVCPNGGCAGGDGSCYNEHNKKLNKKPFLITNCCQWSDYYLYRPETTLKGQFRTSRWFTPFDHGYKFDLYKLPGGRGSNGHDSYYLTLADEGYTTFVATMQQNDGVGVDQADYGLFGVDLSADSKKPHKDPLSYAVRLCNMESLNGVKAIKIGFTSPEGHGVWAYASDSSLLPLVDGWDTVKEDQEAGAPGYWVFKSDDEDKIRAELEGCNA